MSCGGVANQEVCAGREAATEAAEIGLGLCPVSCRPRDVQYGPVRGTRGVWSSLLCSLHPQYCIDVLSRENRKGSSSSATVKICFPISLGHNGRHLGSRLRTCQESYLYPLSSGGLFIVLPLREVARVIISPAYILFLSAVPGAGGYSVGYVTCLTGRNTSPPGLANHLSSSPCPPNHSDSECASVPVSVDSILLLGMECLVCFNLGAQEAPGETLSPNHRMVKFIQLGSLKQSSEAQKCQECKLLWDAILLQMEERTDSEIAGYLQLRFAPNSPLLLYGPVDLELFSRESDGGPRHPTIGLGKEVESHSSASSCLDQASSWLHECLSQHPTCKQASNPRLPTRVIDVGTAGVCEPFLVETHGASGAYVALSYCWGDPSVHAVLKTTHSNFVSHKTAIPHESMPATLRDAVTITRHLGIRYLWIDALCIIQGDSGDWARESGRMCEVYSNAVVTLSVDHADGSSVGVFASQAFGNPPKQLELNGRPVYVRDNLKRKHNDITLLLRTSGEGDGRGEPINKRAWTLQEAILSNRTLHYTSNELVWECNTLRLCACRRGNPVEADEYSMRCFRLPAVFREMSTSRVYLQWRQMLQLFTERAISYEEDRLPALSGIAKQFGLLYEIANGKRDRYFAGLWEGDFATQLLWTADDDYWRDPEIQSRRPLTWRAPSWSWAAVEGPVMFHPMSHFEQDIELLEIHAEALTEDNLFGQVQNDARLIVRGTVLHGLKMTSTAAKPGDSYMGFVNKFRYEVVDGDGTGHTIVWDDPSSIPPEDEKQEYTCLLIGKTSNKGDTLPYYAFLVLTRIAQDASVFRRVAISLRVTKQNVEKQEMFNEAKREVVTIL